MVNSCQKGKRGEREVVDLLRSFGFEARRGQQFKGTNESPDIIHNIEGIFIEVKLRQHLNLHAAFEKACSEKSDFDTAVIFHRKNKERWLVTMGAEDFLKERQGNQTGE